MTILPDLDPEDVSFVAYWNALVDGDVSSIEASDVLTHARIEEYTLYDNGVTGLINTDGFADRDVHFRVKDDGWFVCYLDREERLNTQVDIADKNDEFNGAFGPFDLADIWPRSGDNWGDPSSYIQNTLERSIHRLQSELDDPGGDIDYNTDDVGLYNYEFPDAVATTGLSQGDHATNETNVYGFTYTEGTEILYGRCFGSADNHVGNGDWVTWVPTNTILAGADETSEPQLLGAIDIEDDITDFGVEYQIELDVDRDDFDNNAQGNILIVWK